MCWSGLRLYQSCRLKRAGRIFAASRTRFESWTSQFGSAGPAPAPRIGRSAHVARCAAFVGEPVGSIEAGAGGFEEEEHDAIGDSALMVGRPGSAEALS